MPTKKTTGGRTVSGVRAPRGRGEDSTTSKESKTTGTTGKGWGAVIAKKKQSESKGIKNRPPYLQIKTKFFLQDGESANIQFLDDEPTCVEGCTLPPEHRDFYVSPKSAGKRHCPMVESGLKLTWKGCFKILDLRGKYDVDKKKHVGGEPVEKYWLTSQTVAETLKTISEKKGKPLSKLVLEVTRSGSDKKTTYNFSPALNDDDEIIKPVEWDEELPSSEEVMKPLSDKTLNEILGNSSEDDDDDADIDID